MANLPGQPPPANPECSQRRCRRPWWFAAAATSEYEASYRSKFITSRTIAAAWSPCSPCSNSAAMTIGSRPGAKATNHALSLKSAPWLAAAALATSIDANWAEPVLPPQTSLIPGIPVQATVPVPPRSPRRTYHLPRPGHGSHRAAIRFCSSLPTYRPLPGEASAKPRPSPTRRWRAPVGWVLPSARPVRWPPRASPRGTTCDDNCAAARRARGADNTRGLAGQIDSRGMSEPHHVGIPRQPVNACSLLPMV